MATFKYWLILGLGFTAGTAHAYIDPVTGSFVVQGLVAAFAAAMVFVRRLRERVIGFFRRNQTSAMTEESVADQSKTDD